MGKESDSPREPVMIAGDYRLKRKGDGIEIEVLDYHADPLVLTKGQLNKLFDDEQDH